MTWMQVPPPELGKLTTPQALQGQADVSRLVNLNNLIKIEVMRSEKTPHVVTARGYRTDVLLDDGVLLWSGEASSVRAAAALAELVRDEITRGIATASAFTIDKKGKLSDLG